MNSTEFGITQIKLVALPLHGGGLLMGGWSTALLVENNANSTKNIWDIKSNIKMDFDIMSNAYEKRGSIDIHQNTPPRLGYILEF